MKRLLWVVFIMMFLCLELVISCGGEVSPPKPSAIPRQFPEVWMDSKSGLTWQVSPTGGAMNWLAAKAHCESLNLGGAGDWRLPTISELRGLIRGCAQTMPSGGGGVTDSCLNYKSCRNEACNGCPVKRGPGSLGAYWPPELAGAGGWYWSSSAVADGLGREWAIDFDSGNINGSCVHDYAARCVRP